MLTATIRSATIESPRIYVACLFAYNNDLLHGEWIDVGEDAPCICNGIAAMLKASPIAGTRTWSAWQSWRASLPSMAILAAEFYHHFGEDLAEAREAMTDRYLGYYAGLADYMKEITAQTVAVPSQLAFYIDNEAMARGAEMSGELFTIQTAHDEVHVFAGC